MLSISTLKDKPHYRENVLELIEKEFSYSTDYHYEIDFYPLVHEKNYKNCFLLLEGTKLIGHIGKRDLTFSFENNKSFTISTFGGIALDKSYQGRGLFTYFFNEILKNEKTPFSLLWSDKKELYQKFHFYPAIGMYVYNKINSNINFSFEKVKASNLTEEEIKELFILYNKENTLKPIRELSDFKILEHVSSSNFYIKKNNGKIISYFIESKGQDLQNIIHESYFSSYNDFIEALKRFECWSGINYDERHELVASSLLKIIDIEIFKDFVFTYTKGTILISSIDSERVNFTFDSQSFNLEIPIFLQGIFGPQIFQELSNYKINSIFIPGLDSI